MTVSKTSGPTKLTRRGLLSAVAAISLLSLTQTPTLAFAANFDVDAFLDLSQKLLGQDDLDNDIAGDMLNAFSAIGRKDALVDLAADGDDTQLANAIVASWYTGESPDPDDLQVLTYTDARIWEAMDYTKPLGNCGGGVGYWEDPPAG